MRTRKPLLDFLLCIGYILTITKGKAMQKIVQISTNKHNGLFDITSEVETIVRNSGIGQGTASVYVQGATAAIMIQESWDQSVQNDVVSLMKKLIPKGVWEHDAQDNNGDAHLKSGLIGPGETIPIIEGRLGLSTWQNIFVCEFDGPRHTRSIVVTLTEA
jgi:secondary thiamine-phosphate synthase enzyme